MYTIIRPDSFSEVELDGVLGQRFDFETSFSLEPSSEPFADVHFSFLLFPDRIFFDFEVLRDSLSVMHILLLEYSRMVPSSDIERDREILESFPVFEFFLNNLELFKKEGVVFYEKP